MRLRPRTVASNMPILRAALETMSPPPKSAIECGCGMHSTALLSGITHFVTIEHDRVWGKQVARAVDGVNMLVIDLPGVACEQYPDDIRRAKRRMIQATYNALAADRPGADLIFVDTYRAARAPAVRAWWGKFRVLGVHDTQNARHGTAKAIARLMNPHDHPEAIGMRRIRCVGKDSPTLDLIIAAGEDFDVAAFVERMRKYAAASEYHYDYHAFVTEVH